MGPIVNSKSDENYIKSSYKDVSQKSLDTSMVFTLSKDVGTLADALYLFKKHDVNLKHIDSRPSITLDSHYDFYANIDSAEAVPEKITELMNDLKETAKNVKVHKEDEIPWFPRHISDLDKIQDRILTVGDELESDHPGFTDPVYRERRKVFADKANNYRYGHVLPRVDYTEQEIETWNTVFTELTKLYPTHACKELNNVFPSLAKHCDYRIGSIPQLEDVSNFLKESTGFTLRPVAGLVTPRDFLSALAFRVFFSTQYIRHWKTPMYTPEPDVVHELIGHVPLFSDPGFAQFSQEIGLISLGAPDHWIDKLSTLYWFTVEFGLCRQNGNLKAYGAGLLSSFGELQYCLTDKPKHNPFVPEKISNTTYPITEYQPQYFVADSFDDATHRVRNWASKIPKTFSLRYNPFTQCIETLDEKEPLMNILKELKSDMDGVVDALKKLN